MAPPAKRKRNIVLDEADEQDERHTPTKKKNLTDYFSSPDTKEKDKVVHADPPTPDPPNTSRRTTRAAHAAAVRKLPAVSTRSRQFQSSSTKSPSPSPVKSKKFIDEKGKFANIRTLFSNQSQKVKAEPKTYGHSKNSDTHPLDIAADPLSDDDDDEEISVYRASETSLVGRKAQKRSGDGFEIDPISVNGSNAVGQRFLRPSRNKSASTAEAGDQRPWSERFGPVHLDELVVHKRKVADVRRWLQDILSGRMRQRLLVLKGAAGTGKTTTVQLLAKDMGFEILEWRNPGSTLGSTQGNQSASAQFEEFLGRGRKFGQLDFDTDDSTQATSQANGIALGHSDDSRQRVILIEEFPNTFMRSGSALTSFRRTVLQYLANNTPSLAAFGQSMTAGPIIPVVMVVSETLLTTTSASADSFTAHRLLGPEILRHPGTAVIEFRDIAPTLLAKSLELVVKKEARVSGRRRTPGPQVLKQLGEIGDIRNAISSLEFLCLRGDDADWGSKVAFTKTKKASKDQALTKGEEQSLQLISHREASLGIFHAVGKVVYNKRDELPFPDGSEAAIAEELPPYLSHLSRKKRSEVSVDTLIDETGTDTSTFISALHENYALSCERTGLADPESSLGYVNNCIEYLSEGDLLNPSRDSFFGGKGLTMSGRDQGSHILRQDEMAFEVAVRGLLFSLPCPVKRKSRPLGKGGDAHRMYFPMSGKLWREKEELQGLVDLWASKMLKGENPASRQQVSQNIASGASLFRETNSGSVDESSGQRNEPKYATQAQPTATAETSMSEDAPLVSLGSSALQEMVLERLPYMAHMMRRRRTPMFSLGIRDIEKVASFQGIGAPMDEETDEGIEDEEGAGPGAEAWATDKPTEEATPRKIRTSTFRARSEQSEGSMISSLQVHKLVLSDDDIEDDEDD
ncbi:RFC checkpoint protein Rad17 [Gnomoniopsis smithogilvyi]|uniref:RFC checkpoint protein Rad17 n=1 Tax=Gnomoniopsis smithogilvyi TaxID=1191159 RepID=A0A9W8Z331_9PEZI|nr:RFC checkpoint protein Rad17 [Gnomoniopsis smithogilvyi]